MKNKPLQKSIVKIIKSYQKSFIAKVYPKTKGQSDVLMDLFGITQKTKESNKQFWGRELGMLWQKIVIETFCQHNGYIPAKKYNRDEPYDLQFNNDYIDTKYRIGSGDAGTLKKFVQYGQLIKSNGGNPVLLLLREDNLSSAITACKRGGWIIYQGDSSFQYIKSCTGIDLQDILKSLVNKFPI